MTARPPLARVAESLERMVLGSSAPPCIHPVCTRSRSEVSRSNVPNIMPGADDRESSTASSGDGPTASSAQPVPSATARPRAITVMRILELPLSAGGWG